MSDENCSKGDELGFWWSLIGMCMGIILCTLTITLQPELPTWIICMACIALIVICWTMMLAHLPDDYGTRR